MPKNIKIIGVGSYLPEKILTNVDIEKIVDTTDEWITERTGIKERRIARKDQATSDLGIEAAKKALEDASVDPKELDLILVATITPDMSFPSTACIIQDKLGAENAAALDISAACSGFVYGLVVCHSLICQGQYKKVLLVAAETLSKITNWEDRGTCVLLGDGAGAVVVTSCDCENEGLLASSLGAIGSAGKLLYLPAGGSRNPATHETIDEKMHYLRMQGNELFKVAVKSLVDAAKDVMQKAKVTSEDIALFIPHQANVRIINATAKRVGIPKEKVFINVNKYGNTSAATIPIALNEALRAGRIKKGDLILLDAFGGGLTWGAVLLRW
ncbi:MAG: ketoacyl-ACP synthase III [Candidatus Omnitrophica bacterium]|nr:ketoacyl-ACP synthase III [Candidatus Omnitrophota bacterium]MBU1047665.1 ketoacyl-ACP synthase III [Candidatus Omnitrophota bacterium]MBU1630886.1 ketoacyl-ACP synthase III [Candidatus Omnitrophota bacterium]MBU1767194.1 ketoacyl-ACP synthase III [Candidatus Omnitrophota bacterium]MBU1888605.1 ketoacyl-ACP synthase III [Candidatus Omnitrophota bacterium]